MACTYRCLAFHDRVVSRFRLESLICVRAMRRSLESTIREKRLTSCYIQRASAVREQRKCWPRGGKWAWMAPELIVDATDSDRKGTTVGLRRPHNTAGCLSLSCAVRGARVWAPQGTLVITNARTADHSSWRARSASCIPGRQRAACADIRISQHPGRRSWHVWALAAAPVRRASVWC